jgi:uncharacterized protein (TIGR02265 family)
MAIDPRDLGARLAAATPQDTARGLAFNALFDALEEHLGKAEAVALDPERKARRVEFFSYPVSDYLRISFAGADRMSEKLGSPEAAFHAFGERVLAHVFGSKIGATMFALAGKNGLRALLGQTVSGYRMMVSYGVRRLEWVGERHARIIFERDFLVPAYHCGIFLAGVKAAGAKAERIEGRQTGPLSSTYEIVWADPA